MQKNCGIYKIVNTTNGHFYIGSSSDIDHRFYIHQYLLERGMHHNIHLQRAWQKYGKDVFKFEIEQILPKEQCIEVEQKLLDEHFGKDYCYNLDKWAKLIDDLANQKRSKKLKGITRSVEIRHKMSVAQQNRKITPKIVEGWKKSGEALKKYRQEHWNDFEKKRIDACIGKKQSDSFKKLMSEKMKGRILTDEWKQKISDAQKGVAKPLRTKEHQEKLNAANKGLKRSDETRKKLSEALKMYHLKRKCSDV